MRQAESRGVSQQSSGLKNNTARSWWAVSWHRMLRGREGARCCHWERRVPPTDTSTLPSCLCSCLLVATNTGLSLLLSPTHIKYEPVLHEVCSRRTSLGLLPEERAYLHRAVTLYVLLTQRLLSSLRKSPDTCW